MTKRQLAVRVKEHLGMDAKESAVKAHISECFHCRSADISDFEILKKCSSGLKYQEALLIRKLNPSLNVQLYRKGAATLLKVF